MSMFDSVDDVVVVVPRYEVVQTRPYQLTNPRGVPHNP